MHVNMVVILSTSLWKCTRERNRAHSLSAHLHRSCLLTFPLDHTFEMRSSVWCSSGDAFMESPYSRHISDAFLCVCIPIFSIFFLNGMFTCTLSFVVFDLVVMFWFLYSTLLFGAARDALVHYSWILWF